MDIYCIIRTDVYEVFCADVCLTSGHSTDVKNFRTVFSF